MGSSEYIQVMLAFLEEAGRLAVSISENLRVDLKQDQTVVTSADHAIAELAHRHLSRFVQQEGHLLIEEEDPAAAGFLDRERLDQAEVIWSVDPIDGTRLYANGFPHYAISIGALRHGRPWLGAAYFPRMEELFYDDGEQGWWVKQAFSDKEERRPIVPVEPQISPASIFLCNDGFFSDFSWQARDCHIVIPASAVADMCWPCVGRGIGCMLRASLWDFAGAWPLIRRAGMEMREFDTGRVLERIDPDVFHAKETPWKLKDYFLVSTEKVFHLLRSSQAILKNF